MAHLGPLPIALLIIGTAISPSCKDRSGPPVEPPPGVEPATSTSNSSTSKYRLLYENEREADGESEETGSFLLGDKSETMQLLEDRFRKSIEISEPEDEFLFGIEREAGESLMIKFTPTTTGEARTMIAIWEATENEVTFTHQSAPLESEEEALAVLKSYSSLESNTESSAKWVSRSRGMRVPPD